MASIDTSSAIGRPSFLQFAASLLAGNPEEVKRRRTYRATVRELEALSDRELDDLGIGRSEIRDIARDAAYRA